MRKLIQSIFTIFAIMSTAQADPDTSPLKTAFQQSRAESNIELVLPVFIKSHLFIVTGGQTSTNDYFLVPSPNKERLCVTVSESADNLEKISWPKAEVTGDKLIQELPAGIEIVVVYKDGGDYITREHLQWYRTLIK